MSNYREKMLRAESSNGNYLKKYVIRNVQIEIYI